MKCEQFNMWMWLYSTFYLYSSFPWLLSVFYPFINTSRLICSCACDYDYDYHFMSVMCEC
jgi:hypothetical protein